MGNCIFCKIVSGEIKSEIIYENEDVVCFKDISPSAPVHVLIVSKTHYTNILDLNKDVTNAGRVAGSVFSAFSELGKIFGISDSGFRIINNCGVDGGQTVEHLHFHLLGGETLNPKLL